jgi:hypothetical protein
MPSTYDDWVFSDGSIETDASKPNWAVACDVVLQDYLFITPLFDEAWTPTDDGESLYDIGNAASGLTLGLEPVI